MSVKTNSTLDKTHAHAPAAPHTARDPTARDTRNPLRGSAGQQHARQGADLAQHGVQIHERSRNVDRRSSGKE